MINTSKIAALPLAIDAGNKDLTIIQTNDGVKRITYEDLTKGKADNIEYNLETGKLQLKSKDNVLSEVDITSIEGITYDNATVSADGLMSSVDKNKLDGIDENANNYSLPEGLSTGYVTTGKNSFITVGEQATAEGYNTKPTGMYSHAENVRAEAIGQGSHAENLKAVASGDYSHAEGSYSIASGEGSHAEGFYCEAAVAYSHAGGYYNKAINSGSYAIGKFNRDMTASESMIDNNGDAFVIGNGYSSTRSNAFRVNYGGEVYGLSEFNSSGADYAEFIKPWYDDNPDNEDRVGYFVTVKDGKLYKANEGDYIIGVTSGNPSIVGNADEDYYWRWERDEFNRIIWEDVPEMIEKKDEDGNLIFDENDDIIWEETGRIIEKGRMKLNPDYDSSLQNSYIERKDRPEWDYVGMIGVLPVRDDGTCEAGQYCKCSEGGIATIAAERGFDTYMVIERISDNVISVIFSL